MADLKEGKSFICFAGRQILLHWRDKREKRIVFIILFLVFERLCKTQRQSTPRATVSFMLPLSCGDILKTQKMFVKFYFLIILFALNECSSK